ncbi:HAD-IB family hydrolase [Achromobacter xylosoxidans]|uniref:HAD-IB family hydrolase n=1 Tax=Alcaligenes xylosoxydans xylosoxydans TaxID=85698 RepID=UPI000B48BAFB|nr:HAD-IB family hydrolase [Achromobacter xylosoxidans]
MSHEIPSTLVLPVVAVFDFDGTLTYRDTLIPFLARVSLSKLLLGLVIVSPVLALLLCCKAGNEQGIALRESAKQRLCRIVLRGRRLVDLKGLAARWVPGIALRPDTLARLRAHQQKGHRVAIVSASPDLYLEEVARRLGVALICTSLETGGGRLTGRFSTANCWGPEKVARLESSFGPVGSYELHAYGDSGGDAWLLQAADCAWLNGKKVVR